MPSPHKRVQIVAVPRVYETLRRISACTGEPLGGIVRQMLEEGLPALEGMADALEAVPRSPAEAVARMIGTVQKATAEAQQLGLELEGEQRSMVQRAARHAKSQARRKAARE